MKREKKVCCRNCEYGKYVSKGCRHPENNGSKYFCEEFDRFVEKKKKIEKIIEIL